MLGIDMGDRSTAIVDDRRELLNERGLTGQPIVPGSYLFTAAHSSWSNSVPRPPKMG